MPKSREAQIDGSLNPQGITHIGVKVYTNNFDNQKSMRI